MLLYGDGFLSGYPNSRKSRSRGHFRGWKFQYWDFPVFETRVFSGFSNPDPDQRDYLKKNLIPESTLLFWAMLRFIKNENEILQINNIDKEDSDILDNENSCPSDDCWEMIDGNCSIKTERQESWPKTVICYFTVIAIWWTSDSTNRNYSGQKLQKKNSILIAQYKTRSNQLRSEIRILQYMKISIKCGDIGKCLNFLIVFLILT